MEKTIAFSLRTQIRTQIILQKGRESLFAEEDAKPKQDAKGKVHLGRFLRQVCHLAVGVPFQQIER